MSNAPSTISIDDVQYVRADSVVTGPSEYRIVIAQRGWVFVGRYEEVGDEVRLFDAKTIRTWGTKKGLGELAEKGPQSNTVLDPSGTIRLHRLGVVATLDTAVTSW